MKYGAGPLSTLPKIKSTCCITTSDCRRLCSSFQSSASVCQTCAVAAELDSGSKAYVLWNGGQHKKIKWRSVIHRLVTVSLWKNA